MESRILELVIKYNVEIELKYKKSTIVAIIDNGNETKLIKSGWIIDLIREIEKECLGMYNRQKQEQEAVLNRLRELPSSVEMFPDTLFTPVCKHEWVPMPDSFDNPYCIKCGKMS